MLLCMAIQIVRILMFAENFLLSAQLNHRMHMDREHIWLAYELALDEKASRVTHL